MPGPSIPAEQRRARLGVRHDLARRRAGDPAADAVDLAERLVGLHATDPTTPFLSAWARIERFTTAALETELYDTHRLVKHLAMRRTLFVHSRALLPVVQSACTRAIVARERRRLIAEVEKAGIATDGTRWLRRAQRAVLAALAERGGATGAQITRAVPEVQAKIAFGEGRSWGGQFGVGPRVLTVLAAEGRIRRGPSKSWTSSQHRWELVTEPVAPWPGPDAVQELVRRWLRTFGPATEADIAWWSGLGLRVVRRALAGLDVVAADLDGEPGVVLADDTEPVAPPRPWVAFLPGLDPTTMGWKRRDWYLGPHGSVLFDTNGNAGPTVWSDGRIVGGWTQRPSGEVVYRVLEDIGRAATARIEREAGALQDWLGHHVVVPRFPTPIDRELRS